MRGLGTEARFKWRPSLPFLVLVPLTIAAASVLTYYTWETASRFEELGASSIAHSTLLLVEEKVDRIEQQIISRDNAVFHLIDLDGLLDEAAQLISPGGSSLEPGAVGAENLRARWLPLAERVSPSVRAVLVFTSELEVVDYVARAAPNEQRAFLRLFRKEIAPEIDMTQLSLGQLRHLHTNVNGTSYLISYVAHEHDGQTYLIAAHHDIGFIVREEFPRLFANEEARANFNVVDEDSRRVYGDSLGKVSDYVVGLRFPTTLYRWRLQVAPKDAPLLEQQAREREINKAALLALSVAILILGVAFFIYATLKERRLNALKSDFIANVSHELKTPLSVVRMFAEMLMTGRVASAERQRQYIETICRESERLSGLIENVLDFAALERGKQRYAREAADLSEIVARAVETVRLRLDGVEMRLQAPQPGARVSVDAQAVLLAVINLLDNAIKYGEGSPIDVSVQQQRREVTVAVRDHGPGIPPEETRRVFDRFYRVRRAGPQIRGSGIGLSLVKHIADAHGGRAWAENAPDGGAIVSFSVAYSKGQEREAAAETSGELARPNAGSAAGAPGSGYAAPEDEGART
ncbi:MAG TPA: HAMP domain-containing sensor histidine kinase [Polyangiales bacterium]